MEYGADAGVDGAVLCAGCDHVPAGGEAVGSAAAERGVYSGFRRGNGSGVWGVDFGDHDWRALRRVLFGGDRPLCYRWFAPELAAFE